MPHLVGDRGTGAGGGDAEPREGRGADEAADELRLLAFGLSGEWYALEASQVRGIEPETDITPIPRAPRWLVGVFNLRGTILPVVDPCPLLGIQRRDSGKKGLLVVFQWDGGSAALQVDTVDEMYEVARSSLEPPIVMAEGGRGELIQGQVRVRDRLIGVLDVLGLSRVLLEG